MASDSPARSLDEIDLSALRVRGILMITVLYLSPLASIQLASMDRLYRDVLWMMAFVIEAIHVVYR